MASVKSLLAKRLGGGSSSIGDSASIFSETATMRANRLSLRGSKKFRDGEAVPLKAATSPPAIRVELVDNGIVWLKPPTTRFPGQWFPLRDGVWSVITYAGVGEICMLTHYPLYFALGDDSPKMAGRLQTCYFELHYVRAGSKQEWAGSQSPSSPSSPSLPSSVSSSSSSSSPSSKTAAQGGEHSSQNNIALGFAAKPLNEWRLPGRERGSFAVRCDDGRRLVEGEDVSAGHARPIRPGTVVGIGVRYWPRYAGSKGADTILDGQVFFTRNGKLEWTFAVREARESGVTGDHDLYAAIGSTGEVEYKAVFAREAWKFDPRTLPGPKMTTIAE